MSDTLSFQEASIRSHCQALRLSTVGAQFHKLAEQALREGHSHLHYLDTLLTAELEEREERLIDLWAASSDRSSKRPPPSGSAGAGNPAVGTGVEPVTPRFQVWCSAVELTDTSPG